LSKHYCFNVFDYINVDVLVNVFDNDDKVDDDDYVDYDGL